jgi:hypothetical protein
MPLFGSGRFITGLFFCAFISLVAGLSPVPLQAAEPSAAPQTQIITDQEHGTVTIVIDGKPVVMIDKTGLYVMVDIAYGGTLTDTGSGWIKSRIEKSDSAKDSGGGDDAE